MFYSLQDCLACPSIVVHKILTRTSLSVVGVASIFSSEIKNLSLFVAYTARRGRSRQGLGGVRSHDFTVGNVVCPCVEVGVASTSITNSHMGVGILCRQFCSCELTLDIPSHKLPWNCYNSNDDVIQWQWECAINFYNYWIVTYAMLHVQKKINMAMKSNARAYRTWSEY